MSDGFDKSLQNKNGERQEMQAAEGFRQSLKVARQAAKTSGPSKTVFENLTHG
jgi:hypothetical protein